METFGILKSFGSWYSATLMGTILLMSVYMVALAVVKLRFFASIRVDAGKLMEEVVHDLESGDPLSMASGGGRREVDPPLRILAYIILANRAAELSDLQELMRVTLIRQRERLEKGLSAFGTMAAIGPFLGLLATVLGIIHSFEALAKSGAAGPNVVASGVAEALWGTAAGLVLAIPSVIFYNLFNRKAKATILELELTARELLVMMKGFRQKAGGRATAKA